MVVETSKIGYDYMTIALTKSRLEKGLIAVPLSFSKWLPKNNRTIGIYLDDSDELQKVSFSSYTSSTHENRIGGMKQWFEKHKIRDRDEVVIQIIDKERFIYRLIPEDTFVKRTRNLQLSMDNCKDEEELSNNIELLSNWTRSDLNRVIVNEFIREVKTPITSRDYANIRVNRAKESVPAKLRYLLTNIYKGHCQICDFWFLKRNKDPYFEIHHIDNNKGHHPKNTVVVCGNCHNQFEYADVKYDFNCNSWLVSVSFNEIIFKVNQLFLDLEYKEFHKEIFI